MELLPILVAGALVGAGLFTLVGVLAPAPPNLRTALTRLDTRAPVGAGPGTTATAGYAAWLATAATWLGLDRYQTQLRILEQSPTGLLLSKLGYGLLGVLFAPVLATGCLLLGVSVPVPVPVAASLALGAGLFFVPDLDLHRRAAVAREAMRATVAVYIDLVALERAADAGPTQALHRAATITDSDGFTRIAGALHDAELAGRPAWTGLADLGADLQVPELSDLADIMALSGQDGAAVYATLRARAASLRTQLLATSTARANTASEHMIIPVALLGIAFMALLGYPAFTRILLT